MRRLVFDLDDLLTAYREEDESHISSFSSQIESYRELGFEIVIASSAGMIEHDGNIGTIPGHVAREVFRIIEELDIEYDELVLGKPDAGPVGLVIDDKAVSPEEFLSKGYAEIRKTLEDV
jgi:capsule biosynthesis phosphatase